MHILFLSLCKIGMCVCVVCKIGPQFPEQSSWSLRSSLSVQNTGSVVCSNTWSSALISDRASAPLEVSPPGARSVCVSNEVARAGLQDGIWSPEKASHA